MSCYTSVKRPVYEDTPRDPANGILSMRDAIDWDAIEAENARYARELKEKQKGYPADFFSCDTSAIFNTLITPAKSRPAKPAPREPIACAVCGATFVPKSKRQKFCSLVCKSRDYWSRHAAEKAEQAPKPKAAKAKAKKAPRAPRTALEKPAEVRACEHCGKPFEAVGNRRKYCSVLCCRHSVKQITLGEISCECCGKTFTPATRRHKYCSADCARAKFLADNYARNRAYRAAHKKVYENVCACCGKTWTSNRKAKACSDSCRSRLSYKYEKKGSPRGRKPGRRPEK